MHVDLFVFCFRVFLVLFFVRFVSRLHSWVRSPRDIVLSVFPIFSHFKKKYFLIHSIFFSPSSCSVFWDIYNRKLVLYLNRLHAYAFRVQKRASSPQKQELGAILCGYREPNCSPRRAGSITTEPSFPPAPSLVRSFYWLSEIFSIFP